MIITVWISVSLTLTKENDHRKIITNDWKAEIEEIRVTLYKATTKGLKKI